MSSKRGERGAGPDQSSGSLMMQRSAWPSPKRKRAAPKGGPKHVPCEVAYCEFVVVVLVVVVVAAGAMVLSAAGAIVLSAGAAVVVVSVVVVFSVVLVAAGLPQAATERAATAAVAVSIVRRVEVMSLVPLGG